jgi:hypothetical protein
MRILPSNSAVHAVLDVAISTALAELATACVATASNSVVGYTAPPELSALDDVIESGC